MTTLEPLQEPISASFSQAVIDSLSAHIAVLDANANIVAVNRAWIEFGVQNGSSGATLGMNYLDVCRSSRPEPFADAAALAIEQVLRGERIEASVEYPCHTRTGQRWYVMHVSPLNVIGGGVVVAHTDITERVLRSRAIAESERRYRLLFERNVAGVVRCTLDGIILDCNASMATLLGYDSSAELAGRAVRDFLPLANWDAMRTQIATRGAIVSTETPARRRLGRDVWLIVSATRIDDAEQPFIQATAIDITDKKEREDAYMRQSEIESAISAVYSDLLQMNDDVGVALSRGLHRIGVATGVDRAHLLVSRDAAMVSEHEWVGPGLTYRFARSAAIDAPLMAWIESELRSSHSIVVSSLDEIPDLSTRSMLERAGIGAIVLVPMLDGRRVAGAIAVERPSPTMWTEETLLILHLTAETFGRVLERRNADERLRLANRALESRVQERTVELRALTARLLRIQEEERTRLSRDIHDELGQALTELNLSIGALRSIEDPETRLRAIHDLGEMASRTIQSVQRIAANLRPALLDRMGLIPALDARINEVRRRAGVAASLVVNPPNLDIQGSCATAIYRVVQEALTNVTRHARARAVRVRVQRSRSGLVVVVRDNGIGIPRDRAGGVESLGLLGMLERARMIGATLRIRSIPERGTIVRLSLPDYCDGGS